MKFFNSQSGRIFAETQGRGEPMLLIPGLGMDHTYYRLALPILANDFEVFAVDPRGIGQSDKKTPYSVESWAADFGDVIQEMGRDRCTSSDLRSGVQWRWHWPRADQTLSNR
jgi:pimeloyl-ACP methyl ester carboxylesterase